MTPLCVCSKLKFSWMGKADAPHSCGLSGQTPCQARRAEVRMPAWLCPQRSGSLHGGPAPLNTCPCGVFRLPTAPTQTLIQSNIHYSCAKQAGPGSRDPPGATPPQEAAKGTGSSRCQRQAPSSTPLASLNKGRPLNSNPKNSLKAQQVWESTTVSAVAQITPVAQVRSPDRELATGGGTGQNKQKTRK